jgi:hypothetical protein
MTLVNNDKDNSMDFVMKIPKLYSAREAASLIDGVNYKLILAMCKSGDIDCTNSGNKFLMTKEALYAGFKIPATYSFA